MNFHRLLTVACAVFALLPKCLFAATPSLAAEVRDLPLFAARLEWTGAQEPPDAQSRALLDTSAVFITSGIDAGIAELEGFLRTYPQSAWSVSLHLNLGQYHRNLGRFSLALEHWTQAWEQSRESQDVVGQRLAAGAASSLGCLLGALGKRPELEQLLQDLDSREIPLELATPAIEGVRGRLNAMKYTPGKAYRCGLMALFNLSKAMKAERSLKRYLLQETAPPAGFSVADLLDLGKTHGIGLQAARRVGDGDLPLPCLAHWKLDHFGAILRKEGDRYEVDDPTFGSQLLVRADVLEAELSGVFLLPTGELPAGFEALSRPEAQTVVGRGYPNTMDDGEDTPDCDPCCEEDYDEEDCDPPSANDGEANGDLPPPECCGMPIWKVSQPYINLWLMDTPLFYRSSSGKWVQLKITYKHRGEDRGTRVGGFGPNWSCNWFGMLQSTTGAISGTIITNYLGGGGKRPFDSSGVTLDFESARRFALEQASGNPLLLTPRGFTNRYADSLGLLVGTTNYFVTQRIDAFNRTNRFEYETSGSVRRLVRYVDKDGRTNTLAYTNSSFPHLITSVTSPYGGTAYFKYNQSGWLTNIIDMAGLSTVFTYYAGAISSMTTPYGQSSFEPLSGYNPPYNSQNRALRATEPNGDQQLFTYYDAGPPGVAAEGGFQEWRNSYHWDAAQYAAITTAGKTNLLGLERVDTAKATTRHWLHGTTVSTVTGTLNAMAGPEDQYGVRSPMRSFTYYGQDEPYLIGTLKRVIAVYGPDGLEMEIGRNSLGRPAWITYHNGDGSTASYTNTFDATGRFLQRQTGPHGELVRGYGYHPTIPNLLVSVTNVAGEVIRYTHEATTMKVTSITFPSGLIRSNNYYTSGAAKGFLQQQADLGIRTNSFGYLNGNVAGQTNELGLVISNTWDKLNRLVQTAYPDSTTVSNWFDKLDVRGEKDRLNQWSYYGYDAKRRRVAITNAASQVTLLSYCGCGSPSTITQYKGSTPIYTYHNYDQAGRLTNTIYADGYQLNRVYGQDGDLFNVTDNAGRKLELDYTQVGMKRGLSRAQLYSFQLGLYYGLLEQSFDDYGRVTNSIDRNSVSTRLSYDNLGRIATRQRVGGTGTAAGQERFYYNVRGLTNYVDTAGFSTKFVRDTAGRIQYQTNANLEVLEFTYNPADQLTVLKDGKGQTTRWNYNAYGLVTNKVDAASTEIFRYGYDAGDRLTSRWTVAKGNTYFGYDRMGNLTNIAYPTYTNSLSYDNLNRLTGMVDRAGSTAFTWTDGNQLASEDGPWAEDTVGYAYSGRQRQTLSVAQPNDAPWAQTYVYSDLARLESVISPAGTFSYTHWMFDWVSDISFSGGSHITFTPDDLGRVSQTWLTAQLAENTTYAYNGASQRTQQVFSAGNYLNFTYDNIGQLKTARGYESGGTPRLQEQFGFAYDAAWNLARRTNNALVQTFNVDNRNQLTGGSRTGTLTVAGTVGEPHSTATVTVSGTGLSSGAATVYGDGTWARAGATLTDGANTYTATATDGYGRTSQDSVSFTLPASPSFAYDGNGNLTSDGMRTFEYDFENQLTNVYASGKWRSEFVYDLLGRRRVRKEYTWLGSAWVQTNEVRYVYDQCLVMQERWFNPQVSLAAPQRLITYTRGTDLSGELQEAGGIGGLLARSDSALMQSDPAAAHVFYVADPGGNITAMVNSKDVVVARYQYDPYGNVLSMSGSMAEVNLYRFSSKEVHPNSGLIYYLYRYYEPNLQRWLNPDPLGDIGSLPVMTAGIAPWSESDDGEEMTYGEFLDAWTDINRNLYGAMGNNPVNSVDAFGLQTTGCATLAAEPTLLMSEEATAIYRAAQAAKKAKEIADAAKKAKQIADAAKKAKELKKVRDAEDAINKAKDIQKAQDKVRKVGENAKKPKAIDRITKSEQNMKNQLKDIANDPSCAP